MAKQASPTNASGGRKQPKRPSVKSLHRRPTPTGFSRCNSSVLIRLLDVVASILEGANSPVEIFLHVPKVLLEESAGRLALTPEPRAGRIWLYSGSGEEDAKPSVTSLAEFPKTHPLRDELLMVMISKQMCALVTVAPESVKSTNSKPMLLWHGAISFLPEEIESGVRMVAEYIENSVEAPEAVKWLKSASTGLKRNSHLIEQAQLWGALLLDIAGSINQAADDDREELNWYQTITRIQDAVGWELDIDRLFESIGETLADTVGYDFLELQLLSQVDDEWAVTATFQRNLTDYGGHLLTLILRPERQRQILTEQKPVFVETYGAGRYFANAKLLTMMDIESGVIVPLIHKGEPNGLLKLFSAKAGQITAADIKKFEAIGRILARSLENINSYHLMRRMATTDALTNVYNRRFFTEQITREFNRAKRYGSPLSIIMIDIDHFKHYNDSNGHLAGDRLLSDIANLFKQQVRDSDLIARYGGEEFAVILPQTTLSRGRVVAEKIRRATADHKFPFGENQPDGRLTVSLGIAELSSDMETYNDLINSADVALYRAKSTGRNRCVASAGQ